MFNATSTVDGVAEQTTVANKLKLKFNIKIFDQQLFQTDGDYNVVSTDYVGYSVVYTCSETDLWFFKLRRDYAWILSRKPNMNGQNTTVSMDFIYSQVGMYTNVKNLEPTVQNCNL
jgi:lipocalin